MLTCSVLVLEDLPPPCVPLEGDGGGCEPKVLFRGLFLLYRFCISLSLCFSHSISLVSLPPFLHLSVSLSVCLSLSLCLSVSVSLRVCLSITCISLVYDMCEYVFDSEKKESECTCSR